MSHRLGGPGPRVADALASAGSWGVERIAGALPERAARLAGRSLAVVCYRALRIRRHVVENQLADSFPQADARWVRATARACYRHFGEELAMLAGGARRVQSVLARVDDPTGGGERLRSAVAAHGGALVVTGHLGNWELAGSGVASLGLPVTAVAKRQRGADRHIHALRTQLGLDVVYRDASPKVLLRALREGRVLAIAADQHTRQGAVQLDFLGRPAWTTLGPARLCLAADVPLFFGALVRDGDRYRAVLEEMDRRSTDEDSLRVQLTRRWLRALERAVETWPEQYFWFHRRWKGMEAAGGRRNVAARSEV